MAEPGPLSVGQSRYGTPYTTQGATTLVPGIRGPGGKESVLSLDDIHAVPIARAFQGCPVALTLNGRARPVLGPTTLSRSATV